MEIDDIRGVQSSGALGTLQERNLITVVGRSEAVGHPLLYGTTREFLGHLGLKGLSQLPDLPTLEEMVENRDDLRAFASQFGEELSDEDLARLRAGEAVSEDEVVAGDETATAEEPLTEDQTVTDADESGEDPPATPDTAAADDDDGTRP
jgi:hypothetical protein